MKWEDKIPLGIFYKEDKPTSEDRESALAQKPLVELPLTIQNLEELIREFI